LKNETEVKSPKDPTLLLYLQLYTDSLPLSRAIFNIHVFWGFSVLLSNRPVALV
jgi:hypothetical protein